MRTIATLTCPTCGNDDLDSIEAWDHIIRRHSIMSYMGSKHETDLEVRIDSLDHGVFDEDTPVTFGCLACGDEWPIPNDVLVDWE